MKYTTLYRNKLRLFSKSQKIQLNINTAGGLQHRGYIIPQAVTHSLVLLKMGKLIARNMLR